ncbi:MAG: hypothetical protein ACQEXJ_11925 [Myxococcota bacterium]
MSTAGNPMTLYRHRKRKDWGLAILAWEGRNRRRYQFEDGRLRTFAEGFYNLLEKVEDPPEESAEVLARLQRQLGVSRARRDMLQEAGLDRSKVMTFDDQVTVFKLEYPEGFQDETWAREVRGEGEGRRLKRHRDAAIEQTRQDLSEEELERLMGEGEHEEIRDRVRDVLKRTDLTRPSADLKPLEGMSEEDLASFSEALRDVLYNHDEDYAARFDRYVETLMPADGDGPTWQLATAVQSLVHPDEHICVRPSSFRRQAKWFKPKSRYGSRPSGKLYTVYQEMAHDVTRALQRAGLVPRDLVDIYDFVRVTMRPKAKTRLQEHRTAG